MVFIMLTLIQYHIINSRRTHELCFPIFLSLPACGAVAQQQSGPVAAAAEQRPQFLTVRIPNWLIGYGIVFVQLTTNFM